MTRSSSGIMTSGKTPPTVSQEGFVRNRLGNVTTIRSLFGQFLSDAPDRERVNSVHTPRDGKARPKIASITTFVFLEEAACKDEAVAGRSIKCLPPNKSSCSIRLRREYQAIVGTCLFHVSNGRVHEHRERTKKACYPRPEQASRFKRRFVCR